MRFDLVTIFPEFFRGPLEFGVVARARQNGTLQVDIHNLRDSTQDPHRTTDDRPFGGGEGMVMKPEPVWECLQALLGEPKAAARQASRRWAATRVLLLSAQGRRFSQADARRYAALERLVLLCGRYEGVDERVAEYLADEEVSIGDFVLSGGELGAAVVLDATARLLPGVLGHEQSAINESFTEYPGGTEAAGILDYPHYTRPVSFQGWEVPEVLRGGHHAAIQRWRRRRALEKTWRLRPDLLEGLPLSEEDARLLAEIRAALSEHLSGDQAARGTRSAQDTSKSPPRETN